MEQTLVSQLSEEENEQMKANLTKMLSEFTINGKRDW